MTDFQKLMSKLPEFKLTDRTFMDSSIYDCSFYKHDKFDIWITDYDIPRGASGGGNLMESNRVFVFNEANKKGCMVSVEMMQVCIENKASLQHIINQIINRLTK